MLDFARLAAKHRIPILQGGGHHHTSAKFAQTHCPHCSGGRGGWHLGFSLDRGVFSCWRCGALRFRPTLAALLHLSERSPELSRLIAEYQTGPQRVPKEPVVRQRSIKLPPDTGPLLPAHRRYLEGRGFDPTELEKTHHVCGTGRHGGLWAWRVVVPVYNGDDRMVAYQGRAIGDVKPKYKMADDAVCLEDPTTLLYGINLVPGDNVIVVEGVTGVWRLGAGAVATMGIGWKLPQADRLRRFKRRFILYDPEPEAQRRARALAEVLALFGGETEILSGFKTDPGEFSKRKAAKIRRELGF